SLPFLSGSVTSIRLFNCYGISPTLLSETFLRNCIDHGVRCLEFTNGLKNFIGRS
ncbi:hypothetical protein AAVH_31100, partial [Aphelenchoides avenae]